METMRKLGVHVRLRLGQLSTAIRALLKRPQRIETAKRKPPAAVASLSVIADHEDITTWFQANKTCPDCGGSRFIDGPRGGMSKNIRCENAACGSQFNVAAIQGHVLFAQRIHWEKPAKRTIH
jgi:hypothetical protein